MLAEGHLHVLHVEGVAYPLYPLQVLLVAPVLVLHQQAVLHFQGVHHAQLLGVKAFFGVVKALELVLVFRYEDKLQVFAKIIHDLQDLPVNGVHHLVHFLATRELLGADLQELFVGALVELALDVEVVCGQDGDELGRGDEVLALEVVQI